MRAYPLKTARAVFLSLLAMGCRGESAEPLAEGIGLDTVVVLGSEADPASPHPLASVTAWSEGRFVVAPTYDDGTLHVYSSQGTMVGRLGRAGDGPGEFAPVSIFQARTLGETLWVSTQQDPRLTGFTSGGQPPRTVPTPWPVLDFVPLSHDQVLFLPFGPSAPSLASLDLDSGVSHDLPLPEQLRGSTGSVKLILGRGKDGGAWLASADSGLVLPVSGSGVAASGFSISSELHRDGGESAEPPSVYALWEGDGILWILVSLNTEGVRAGRIDVGFMDRYFDTRILALDATTGEVLGRGRDDRLLAPVRSPTQDLVSHLFEDERGDTRIAIFHLTLRESQ